MTTILVTGKNSQLAQCIESLASNYIDFEFIFKTSAELDITNSLQVTSVFSGLESINYCINCAAYTAVDKAEIELEKANAVNFEGVKNLAKACQDNQVIFIHISTDFLFDGKSSKPYTENSVPNPLSIYGKTKLKGERAVQEILTNYFIIRTSWLYSEYGNNFLKTMLRLSRERDEIGVVADQIGSPTYAKDLAEMLLQLVFVRSTSYGIYNYSNEGMVSWYDFAEEIFRLSNSNIRLNKIKTKDYPTPATRPKFSILNTRKISKELKLKIPNWKTSLAVAISNL